MHTYARTHQPPCKKKRIANSSFILFFTVQTEVVPDSEILGIVASDSATIDIKARTYQAALINGEDSFWLSVDLENMSVTRTLIPHHVIRAEFFPSL